MVSQLCGASHSAPSRAPSESAPVAPMLYPPPADIEVCH
jgi:hypothetical protein